MDPGYHGPSLCLNCLQPCTMNLPPFAVKSELDQAAKPVYLISYKYNGRNSETGNSEIKTVKMTNTEVLTYVFELPPSQVVQLINLQVNSMLMCRDCTQILARVFSARDEFQQLTSTSSYLNSIFKPTKPKESNMESHLPSSSEKPCNILDLDTCVTSKLINRGASRPKKKRKLNKVIKTKTTVRSFQIKPDPAFDCMKPEDLLHMDVAKEVEGDELQAVKDFLNSSPGQISNSGESSSIIKLEPVEVLSLSSFCKLGELTMTIRSIDFEEPSKPILEKELNSDERDSASAAGSCTKKRRYIKKEKGSKQKRKRIRPVHEIRCQQCGKVFHTTNAKSVLRLHNEIKHGQLPAFPCDICGRPCQNLPLMRAHRLTHLATEERTVLPFLCPECGKQFTSKGCLKKHISQIHRKDYKYPEFHCEKCGAIYNSKAEYKTHMKRHEIEEGDTFYFFCKLCPAKFKFREERRMHGPACPGEVHFRPHVCPECSRRFKLKQSLELHLNAVHKYSVIAGREVVYPGLGPRKFPNRAEVKYKKKKSV